MLYILPYMSPLLEARGRENESATYRFEFRLSHEPISKPIILH